MEFGLKLWSINTDYYLAEARRLYEKGVYSYIELYAVPHTLEHIEKWKKLDIPFVIHCPHSAHGFNLASKESESENLKLFEETRLYADALDARIIIVHGGIGGDINETARQFTLLNDSRAIIENKPYLAILPPGYVPKSNATITCRGYDKNEIERVTKSVGCGFCLDFVHAVCSANSLKKDIYEHIRSFMELKPTMYHLSNVRDTASEYDSHMHLSAGKLKIGRLLSGLADSAKITLETEKEFADSLSDFEADIMHAKKFDISWRKAAKEDLENLFNLRNDAETVKNSFTDKKVEYEDHVKWFSTVLSSKDKLLFTAENANKDFVGQIRFDRENERDFVVSFSISATFRGSGVASHILKKQTDLFCLDHKGCRLKAYIKPENIKSSSCFKNAGFIQEHIIDGSYCYVKEI